MSAFRLTKPHREQIDALVAAGFAVEPVRWGKGGHLLLRVRHDEAGAGVVTIAGSPSDRCARKNLVRCARQACRVA